MSNSNEFEQITENVYYKTENDIIIFYDISYNKLGQVRKILDEDNKVLEYSNFKKESEAFSNNTLQAILIKFIDSANILQLNKLVIENFPISFDMFNSVVNIFIELYPKAITISYEKNESDDNINNIHVNFKNPRITHYVQQAYLRNFSSNIDSWKDSGKKDRARIYCFDKGKCSVITIGNTKVEREQGIKINRVAYREYYYSLYLEEFMRHTLEKIIPPLIEKVIISKSLKDISNNEKFLLSQYIILSWARTVEAREHLRESLEKGILEAAKMEFGAQAVEGLKVKVNETQLRISHEEQIMNFLFPKEGPRLADRLKEFNWGLIKKRYRNIFLTSDTPVVFHNSFIEKQIKRRGKNFIIKQEKKQLDFIKSKKPAAYINLTSPKTYNRPGVEGIEIYLPLSSNLCLYLVDKKPKFKPLRAKKINKLIILQSEEFVFSQFNNLDFVKIIINKHPECVQKTGKRSIVTSTILEKKGNKKKRFESVKPLS